MAIGSSTAAPPLSGLTAGQGVANGNGSQAGVPFGLRGAVSLGSGLRTGVTVVERALETAAELDQARQRAREALEEQARLEQESAAAQQDALRAEAQALSALQGTVQQPQSTGQAGGGAQDEDANRQSVGAAVAAGEAGGSTPRGTYLDLSI